jgi:predicted GH43/DUF377 family glycosyl hydrolase
VTAATPTAAGLVRRTDLHLGPDPSRVVAQLFIAGEELSSGSSRATPVMQRVLALDDRVADALLADTLTRFGDRHPDLPAILLEHFDRVRDRLGAGTEVSVGRRMLIGAYATNEFAVEAAALCNPSIVAHPDQLGLAPGELRVVLSLRAVGEGHISAIEFRTGVLGPQARLRIDDPGPHLVGGRVEASAYSRSTFRALLGGSFRDHEIATRIFDSLAVTFTGSELDAAIAGLRQRDLVRRETRDIIERLRAIAASNYALSFPTGSGLGQRVLQPHGPSESRGMEDARFVRFTDDDGRVTYFATYTAFDGVNVAPQLLVTPDFERFEMSQLTGQAATNKGMALFPRRIAGRYTALSRWDRETIAVTTSSDAHHWDRPRPVRAPDQPWELIQIGNCGSPIETPDGWLVLTHGVGPMRTYSLGAMLLDGKDPARVIARLPGPLLTPDESEREGYVPNVVYTCGALVHDQTLVLPYAYGDRVTTLATVSLPALLGALQ